MEKTIKFGVYNENCVMAGKCFLGSDDELDSNGDVTIYEGTEKELREIATYIADHSGNGGHGTFRRKVAQTIINICDYQF